jgi:hypothetical protein
MQVFGALKSMSPGKGAENDGFAGLKGQTPAIFPSFEVDTLSLFLLFFQYF